MVFKSSLCFASFVALAAAHIDINYPTSSWVSSDSANETAVCGGASRGTAVSWGTQNPTLSISGDAGHTIRILMATTNSASENTTITDASSFPITLAEGVTLPESGNLCLSLTLPDQDFVQGARATLMVEATGDDETDVSCAEVVLVPADTAAAPAIEHGEPVLDPTTGDELTLRQYWCPNSDGQILALDPCSCHCHGTESHCSDECSTERIDAANVQCASGETEDHDHDDHDHDESSESGACECHCHDDHAHCSDSCAAEVLTQANTACAAGQTPTVPAAAATSTAASTGAGVSASTSLATGSVASAAQETTSPTSDSPPRAIKIGLALAFAGLTAAVVA
ncbi:hypothetical protein OIO90_005243 [Microbotryomycetes sp. JL221]|nr:hypothetical protein OIO90_005243 [Microbotryomycetes sp. JL221]